MTTVFGLSMVIIGSTSRSKGAGPGFVVSLADTLAGHLGTGAGRCSWSGPLAPSFGLLVWQAVPYIFADYWRVVR